jgi:SAM-dependent methyltransferase
MNVGGLAYWDERYKVELAKLLKFELFDWYCSFDKILPEIESVIDFKETRHKILIIGVGRSNIIDVLYKKGFRDLTAIDISSTIIIEMQKKYESYAGVELYVMDVRELLKFNDNTFTLIIDKACIDAMFCGTDYIIATKTAMGEIFRCLRPDGHFVSISHASPLSRVPYLRAIKWAIDCYKVPPHIGEGLTLFVQTKTEDDLMLNRKVAGGEAIYRPKAARVVSNLDQNMNKASTTRASGNTGSITVTASVDALAEMVNESADIDS